MPGSLTLLRAVGEPRGGPDFSQGAAAPAPLKTAPGQALHGYLAGVVRLGVAVKFD